METLENLDRELFLFLNGKHNSFFDHFFFFTSQVVIWIPLYLFFAFLIIKKFRQAAWIPLLSMLILVAATDQGSVFVKNSVKRYRPSHNMELKDKVHTIKKDLGGVYGFVSSHSANTFGLAVFLILCLGLKKKYFSFLLLFWAAVVSYGRIYGGLHYPADIAGGAILGISLAFLIFKIQSAVFRKYFPQKNSSHSNTNS